MHQLRSPLNAAEMEALKGIQHSIQRDEDNLPYAFFNSPDDLLLAQTVLAEFRYGSLRQVHVDTDQSPQHIR